VKLRKRCLRIKEAINMVLWKHHDEVDLFTLVILDRFKGITEIPFKEIERVDNYYVYLRDEETVIPVHRVLEIRKGRSRVWRRGE